MSLSRNTERGYVALAKQLGEVREGAQFFRIVEIAIANLPEQERRVAAGLLCDGAACWADATADYTAELARTIHRIDQRPIRRVPGT